MSKNDMNIGTRMVEITSLYICMDCTEIIEDKAIGVFVNEKMTALKCPCCRGKLQNQIGGERKEDNEAKGDIIKQELVCPKCGRTRQAVDLRDDEGDGVYKGETMIEYCPWCKETC